MNDLRADNHKYRSFMVKFADEYTSDDLTKLKYVSKDHIPAGKMEQLNRTLDVFSQLEQQGLVGPNNFDFLLDLVEAMNTPGLLLMLKEFDGKNKVDRMREKIRKFKLQTGKDFRRLHCFEQYSGISSRRMAF